VRIVRARANAGNVDWAKQRNVVEEMERFDFFILKSAFCLLDLNNIGG
jgi:hypothetical protein